jgi:phosphocarrier protein HPr
VYFVFSATTKIVNAAGLHARPANLLVTLCASFQCDIKLISGKKIINGKSIFSVLGGAIKQGDEITIQTEGPDEQEAGKAILALLQDLGNK